ncbi:hypothetical protein F5Y15DRAFT_365384 [Xylariaceae sp. FL0016]|nr:hypothetical protein F5Y15DRAFT_365384 [Xylariaceae sp. FL0016]
MDSKSMVPSSQVSEAPAHTQLPAAGPVSQPDKSRTQPRSQNTHSGVNGTQNSSGNDSTHSYMPNPITMPPHNATSAQSPQPQVTRPPQPSQSPTIGTKPKDHRQTESITPTLPSPKQKHASMPEFDDDFAKLSHLVSHVGPPAVRKVVRDHWEKTLLGSEFHHAFLLNAAIHHANGSIIRRAIKNFGGRMVRESKTEIVSHFSPQDLDHVADDILGKCSDSFLDKALEKRLKTIDARSLINALARAERLGYESSDVLEEQEQEHELLPPPPAPAYGSPAHHGPPPQVHRGPTAQAQPTTHPNWPAHQSQQPSQAPQAPPAPPAQALQCPMCWRTFQHSAPYEYHVQKQICAKEAPGPLGFPFRCEQCGAGFITKVGQQYHLSNLVCGNHRTASATPKAAPGPAPASPIVLSSGTSTLPQARPSSTPSHSYPSGQNLPASQSMTTPVRFKSQAQASPSSDDPYAHLLPGKKEELMADLKDIEMAYAPRFAEAEAIPDPATRKLRIDSLQNSFSTKQSITRKKYGVKLRQRRTRAEIEEERARMGTLKKQHSPTSYAPSGQETPSLKRMRMDPSYTHSASQPVPSLSTPEPPTKAPVLPMASMASMDRISVSDMNSTGLGGSSATAATADPTLSMRTADVNNATSSNGLSSLQRKGFRVSSHLGRPNLGGSPSRGSGHASPSDGQRSGSATAPLVVDDDSSESDDTDSDVGIPASMPPGKTGSGI